MKNNKISKKRNNKGFSMVELIIVIAIMAALVGILAPQYIKYVEKSKVSADLQNADKMLNAVKVAAAEDLVNKAYTATFSSAGIVITGTDAATASPVITKILGGDLTKFKQKASTPASYAVTVAWPVAGEPTFTQTW